LGSVILSGTLIEEGNIELNGSILIRGELGKAIVVEVVVCR